MSSQKPRKSWFSKSIVAFVILSNVAFVAAVLWIFSETGQEPTTTIAAWFGFTTVELWTLATIEKKKIGG